MQEPMQTWASFVPSTSSIGTTLSGLCGRATIGPSLFRSISTSSSYSGSGSALVGRHISSRFWARKYSRVRSSEGKMEVVAPSSAPMLVMVLRSGTLSGATPSP